MFAYAALHGTLRSVSHLSRTLSAKGIASVRATSRQSRRAALLACVLLMTHLFVSNRLSGDVPPPPPNIPPSIENFTAHRGITTWTITGQVLDENPNGLVVLFGDLLNGHSVTVTSQYGYFAYDVQISGSGSVSAHTIDNAGQSSDYVEAIVIQ